MGVLKVYQEGLVALEVEAAERDGKAKPPPIMGYVQETLSPFGAILFNYQAVKYAAACIRTGNTSPLPTALPTSTQLGRALRRSCGVHGCDGPGGGKGGDSEEEREKGRGLPLRPHHPSTRKARPFPLLPRSRLAFHCPRH